MAPSAKVVSGLGMIFFQSSPMTRPNPLQQAQAPIGELKEKSAGVAARNFLPLTGDSNASLNRAISEPSSLINLILPPPKRKALKVAS